MSVRLLFQCRCRFPDNKRLDEWVDEDRVDLTQLQAPKKDEPKKTPSANPVKKARIRTASTPRATPQKRKAETDGETDTQPDGVCKERSFAYLSI